MGVAGSRYGSVNYPPNFPPVSSPVSIQFGNTGLSSLQWNGTEMLAGGFPVVQWIGLVQPNGNWTSGDTDAATSVDIPDQVVCQKFKWGSILYFYSTTPTALYVSVTIQNASSTPIGDFGLQLAQLHFPGTPSEYDGSDPMMAWNLGNPSIIPASFSGGTLDITNQDVASPLMIGLPWPVDSAKTTFPLLVLTGGDSMLPSSFPFIDRQVPAKGTLSFKIGLRFGPRGTSTYQLAGDIYQQMAASFPQKLRWPDRRPIAQIVLASQNGSYPTNPRCWFGDSSVDTTTPAGVAAFQKRLLALADQAVAICKAENAQGAITWDIEGEQFPQNTTYIGDPRLIPLLDPEMEGVVKAYFKKFTSAGLRIGMTIRPQQLVLYDNYRQAYQEEVADPGKLMIQKMTYAYKTWGATLFYVDSNGAPDDPMDPKFFQEVAAALPNVLVIPEHANMEYYSITAPYGQLNLGVTGTPSSVLLAYPNAFSVFTVSDANIAGNLPTLIDSVTRGDVLFFRGWFNANENPQVRQIYQQAAAGTN